MIQTFRKKPVTVDTVLWDGTRETLAFLEKWAGNLRDDPTASPRFIVDADMNGAVYNDQEQCWVNCPRGHRVVKGRLGEFYPISPEAVEERRTSRWVPRGQPTVCECDSLRGIICAHHAPVRPSTTTNADAEPDSEWSCGWETGYQRGYAAGYRDASQPTSNQPVAGGLVGALQVAEVPDGD